MARYKLADAAKTDLREIAAYTRRDSLAAAKRVVRRIREQFKYLASWPGAGHSREDLTDRPVLFYSVYSYLIVYRSDLRPIRILRVIHGRRDVAGILRRERVE